MIFIHKGKGKLRTMMGNIPFEYGDYLIIPRGIIKLIDTAVIDCCMSNLSRLFIRQNAIKNESGQHLEHAPFCERDFILPTN
jgi:homogentisate 1,2-dioxygenase